MPLSSKEWLSETRTVAGVMTGTSLDGIDIALARFEFDGRHKFEIIKTATAEIPKRFQKLASRIINEAIPVAEISKFHYALARLFAYEIKRCLGEALSKTDAVGIHGQTVWHQPEPVGFSGFEVASSLQLCSNSALAAELGIPVAGDFRAADISLGGQGAPLVPIFDYEYLRSEKSDVIALNIGGISNITFMPAGCGPGEVTAFDTGPGNMLIDRAAWLLLQKDYDAGGYEAGKGCIIKPLLRELMAIPFIGQKPPKTTGRELFNFALVDSLIKSYCQRPKEDILATLTAFTAKSIASNIRQFANPKAQIVVSGGGINNSFLMNLLQGELPEAWISRTDDCGIPSDHKEALCFAYLAWRTFGGLPGNMPSVTGASRETVLGTIAYS